MSNSNNWGGKREGAGRKPRADEIKMIDNMDATRAPKKVWEDLAKLCEEGNERAVRTWLQYRFGKPTEKIDLNSNADQLMGFKVIKASND